MFNHCVVWVVLMCMGLVCVGAFADEQPDPAREKILKVLEQPISLSIENATVKEVFDSLKERLDVNMVVNWRALSAAGVGREHEVEAFEVNNVKACLALVLLLDHIGGDLVPMGYDLEHGALHISTRDNLGRFTIQRTYDIRELIELWANAYLDYPLDCFDLIEFKEKKPQFTQSLFDCEDDDSGIPRAERIEQIMQLIRDTVDPDDWRASGGLVAAMAEIGGVLVINAPRRVHDQVSDLLEQLTEAHTPQVALDVKLIHMPVAELEKLGRADAEGRVILDRAAADRLVDRAIAGEADMKLIASSRMLTFNGQQVQNLISTLDRSDNPIQAEALPQAPSDDHADDTNEDADKGDVKDLAVDFESAPEMDLTPNTEDEDHVSQDEGLDLSKAKMKLMRSATVFAIRPVIARESLRR